MMFNTLTGGSSKAKPKTKQDEKSTKIGLNPLFEMIPMKARMLVFMVVIAMVMVIHLLPVGDNFFAKIGSIRKFLHGDLTKEVTTWKTENTALKKQLEESEKMARSLRTAKTSEEKIEEAKQKQLEQKLTVAEEQEKDKIAKAQDAERTAETRADQMERKMDAMQNQLTEAQQREQATRTKLDKLKQKEMDLLKDFN